MSYLSLFRNVVHSEYKLNFLSEIQALTMHKIDSFDDVHLYLIQ